MSQRGEARHPASRFLAYAGVAAGGLLALVGLVLIKSPDSAPAERILGGVLALLGTLAIVRGRAGLARGRKRPVLSMGSYKASDSEMPVLYLRSFEDDADGGRYAELPSAMFVQAHGANALLSLTTEEEQIGRAFANEGPIVAVEDPRSPGDGPGAPRLRIDDDKWREEVINLIRRSCRIILRAGFGQGLQWEIATVMQEAKPDRVLLLIPFGLGKYRAFVQSAGHLFRGGLPPFAWSFIQLPMLPGVVLFDAGWAPRFVPLRIPVLPVRAIERALRRALKRQRPGRRPSAAMLRQSNLMMPFDSGREQTYKLGRGDREQELRLLVKEGPRGLNGSSSREVEVYVDGRRIGPRLSFDKPDNIHDVSLADGTTLRIQVRAGRLALSHEGLTLT